MKISAASATLIGLSMVATNALAQITTVYDNGQPRPPFSRYSSSSDGSPVPLILDSFTLTTETLVTGFQTWSGLGNAPDYESTVWEIWATNPGHVSSLSPFASGDTAGFSTVDGAFISTTVSGLSVKLGPGTYWLGFGHRIDGTAQWAYANSTISTGHDALGTTTNRAYMFYVQDDPAFRINGITSAIPESSTLPLMAMGLFAISALIRARSTRHAV